MVTPLLDRDTLDVASLARLIEHLLGSHVSGLFILGTTGEGVCLSYNLRRALITRVCRDVAGRVPVLVGISDTAIVESLHLAKHAAAAGADAVVVAPPYYIPLGQPELQHYLEQLVAELPLPLFLYNFPALTKVSIKPDIVRWAVGNPRIAGIKDSSGDMAYGRELIEIGRGRADWTTLVGPEELLGEAILAGAHGGVNGGANVFPTLYVALYEAARDHDLARVATLHSRVLQVCSGLYRVGRHSSAVVKGLKCALSCLGFCRDVMAEPSEPFRQEDRARIQHALDELLTLNADIIPPAATRSAS